ncbi:MAG TPA: hypothetical protein VIN61_07970 [Gammaproteobacteria bacterium]
MSLSLQYPTNWHAYCSTKLRTNQGDNNMQLIPRLFVGGYRELRRPVNEVDEALMRRIEEAHRRLRLAGKDIKPVRRAAYAVSRSGRGTAAVRPSHDPVLRVGSAAEPLNERPRPPGSDPSPSPAAR